ncbi:UBP50 hydrolase, partial [Urocolius indicus]|nr:UBP50 hydrolase [Urocolius indicus]
ESVNAFGCLMYEMWFGEFDCVSPHLFYSAFRKRYSTFGEKTQQDAQEFLLCVLNELHEALKKVRIQLKRRCAINAGARGENKTSVITELFEGQLSYRIICLDCETTTDRSESFTVLSLPIPSKGACSLQDCLSCFFQQDTLTLNNQVYCYQCGTTKDAAVKATITKAPQVIIFHLKRFEWQGKIKGKLSTDICYPLSNLDLSAYTSPLCSEDAEYSLCAVVNHSGFLDDGHYTAFCKNSITRNWYNFDDTQITEIPPSSVQTSTAYLLFY